jgi:1-acyl-sn-glycerol-3-phosphate acyltransferase
MLLLRSLAFNIAFYVNIIVWMIVILPTLVLPRRVLLAIVKAWARSNDLLLRGIAGIRTEIRGLEHLPPGPVLVAAKHQSAWETFALVPLFDDPSFVLKRDLMFIPFFGWYAGKVGMIAVDRGARSAALRSIAEQARMQAGQGRQIVIFPEGTRRAPGAPPAYKYGVAHLYAELDLPCLPIALNSGCYWPRRRFIRRPGTIRVEILPPIAPGLDKKQFLDTLQASIETASDRLLDEASRETGLDLRALPSDPD